MFHKIHISILKHNDMLIANVSKNEIQAWMMIWNTQHKLLHPNASTSNAWPIKYHMWTMWIKTHDYGTIIHFYPTCSISRCNKFFTS